MTGPWRRVPWARLGQLAGGTVMMGTGIALLVAGRLGMVPMDALHLAVARAAGWDLGRGILLTQLILLLSFIPLRVRPGVATLAGFVIPAVTADVLLALLPPLTAFGWRLAAFLGGSVLLCTGVALYLLTRLGQLPRDGIMLALAGDRTVRGGNGRHVALLRVGIDLTFLALATLLLGPAAAVHSGVLSIGTCALALLGGPAIARALTLLARIPGFSPPAGTAQAPATTRTETP